MAHQLVDALTGDFDASRYHDEYREALLKVIEAKVEGQPIEAPEPVAETSKLTDLMAILEASVAAARGEAAARDEAAGGKAAGGVRLPRSPVAVADEPVSVAEARKARAGRGQGGVHDEPRGQARRQATRPAPPDARRERHDASKAGARRRKTA